jgi:hypothetical protein
MSVIGITQADIEILEDRRKTGDADSFAPISVQT